MSRSALAVVVCSCLLGAASSQAAAQPSVTVTRVSASSPFDAGACLSDVDSGLSGSSVRGSEAAPSFAVSPQGLVAAWRQDGGLGIVAARSGDGGASWAQTVPPALSVCENGGNALRVTDPRLAVDGAGTTLLSAVADSPDPRSAVTVSASPDGGRNWSRPQALNLLGAQGPNQQPTISVDPADPRATAVVWASRAPDAAWFSRTTDDGTTWSIARPIRTTPPGALGHDSLVTLPDGTLIDVTTDNALPAGAANGPDVAGFGLQIHALRSTDNGAKWSESTIADLPTAGSSSDAGFPTDPVVGPDGSAYVLFPDVENGTTTWRLFRSADGAEWSQAATVPLPADALVPDLAIAADGTIGVLYDDHRNDADPADQENTTDVWLTNSRDGGQTWSVPPPGEAHSISTRSPAGSSATSSSCALSTAAWGSVRPGSAERDGGPGRHLLRARGSPMTRRRWSRATRKVDIAGA